MSAERPLFTIRATHVHGFRSGQWAQVLAVAWHQESERPCYLVRFPDGAEDVWPVYDASDPYEFGPMAHTRWPGTVPPAPRERD